MHKHSTFLDLHPPHHLQHTSHFLRMKLCVRCCIYSFGGFSCCTHTHIFTSRGMRCNRRGEEKPGRVSERVCVSTDHMNQIRTHIHTHTHCGFSITIDLWAGGVGPLWLSKGTGFPTRLSQAINLSVNDMSILQSATLSVLNNPRLKVHGYIEYIPHRENPFLLTLKKLFDFFTNLFYRKVKSYFTQDFQQIIGYW